MPGAGLASPMGDPPRARPPSGSEGANCSRYLGFHVALARVIARHAGQETLYDQPQEGRKKVRVTGPFTVESLSPHRTLEASDTDGEVAESGVEFVPTILENLRKAGVQNTVKQEHLSFDWLDPYPGAWVHARGVFTDADGAERTVAVSVGPEYGTVDVYNTHLEGTGAVSK